MNNYRPISIQNVFSKVFEYALLSRIQKYFSTYEVIHKSQFGFVYSSSTVLATTNLMSFIRVKLHRGLFVAGVFINLRKAFDCVDHALLLLKMYKEGVRGDEIILEIGYILFRPMDPKANPVKLRQVWCRGCSFPDTVYLFIFFLMMQHFTNGPWAIKPS
jgi:hypothetical protein